MALNEKWLVSWPRVIQLIIFATLLAILPGCSRSDPEAEIKTPAGGISLKGAGATFPSLLYKHWFSIYHDIHPNIAIKYAVVGICEGLRRFIGKNVAAEESVDFGASDAAMSDMEIERADHNALMIPVTAGCVVIAYNVPGVQDRL